MFFDERRSWNATTEKKNQNAQRQSYRSKRQISARSLTFYDFALHFYFGTYDWLGYAMNVGFTPTYNGHGAN